MSSLSARRRFDVVTCSAASAGSAELLEQMEYRPRSPDNSADSAAAPGLDNLLAVDLLGAVERVVAGGAALVLAVALAAAPLACRQA